MFCNFCELLKTAVSQKSYSKGGKRYTIMLRACNQTTRGISVLSSNEVDLLRYSTYIYFQRSRFLKTTFYL